MYPVIGVPPLYVGWRQVTGAYPLPAVATTAVGPDGTVRTGGPEIVPGGPTSHCTGCGEPGDRCPGCQRPLDPPRFCPRCGRRLTVAVSPGGFRARCRDHGRSDPV